MLTERKVRSEILGSDEKLLRGAAAAAVVVENAEAENQKRDLPLIFSSFSVRSQVVENYNCHEPHPAIIARYIYFIYVFAFISVRMVLFCIDCVG